MKGTTKIANSQSWKHIVCLDICVEQINNYSVVSLRVQNREIVNNILQIITSMYHSNKENLPVATRRGEHAL